MKVLSDNLLLTGIKGIENGFVVLYIHIEGVTWFRQGTRWFAMHAGYVIYPVSMMAN